MKKILFVALVLVTVLWSCSQNDKNDAPNDYVSVTIGSVNSDMTRSYVAPGGVTSWNIDDNVLMIDVDGELQEFKYAEESPKSNAEFKGMLRAGQGKQLYKAFHAPRNSHMALKDGHILIAKREDIVLQENGETYNSEVFGSYCPMVSIPVSFTANNSDDPKRFQFYHLTNMILGRLSLSDSDTEILDQTFTSIRFDVWAKKGSKPFYSTIEFDMNLLTENSTLPDFDEYIINTGDESVKTDRMYTIMDFKGKGCGFTIRKLMEEYSSVGSFPIPILAFPTEDSFDYGASLSFYEGDELKIKFEGGDYATGLGPAGLNVLNFDSKKLVKE